MVGLDASVIELYTEAAGSVGCGSFCEGSWCSGSWPQSWVEKGFVRNLVLLELIPILVDVNFGGMIFILTKFAFIVTIWVLSW